MLQEDQSIVVNYCEVVSASPLGIQGDPYSIILRLRYEVLILGFLDRASRAPFLVTPSPLPTFGRTAWLYCDRNSSAAERVVGGWVVQEHISSFGGNPDHVVIMGTSLGGGDILHHLAAYGSNP
jgi:hypothetical protein